MPSLYAVLLCLLAVAEARNVPRLRKLEGQRHLIQAAYQLESEVNSNGVVPRSNSDGLSLEKEFVCGGWCIAGLVLAIGAVAAKFVIWSKQ
jgi:hypothetical protein